MSLLSRFGLKRKPGLLILDAASLAPIDELDVGGWRGRVVARGDDVWVLSPEERTVARLDAGTGTTRAEIELAGRPSGLALDDRGLLTTLDGRSLVRHDPATLAETRRSSLPAGTDSVVAGSGAVWGLGTSDDDALAGNAVHAVCIDPGTLDILQRIDLGRSRYTGAPEIASGAFIVTLEVAPGEMGDVALDARTGARRPSDQVPPRTRALATDGANLWRVSGEEVRRVDAATGDVVARRPLPNERGGPAALAGGRLFVISHRTPRKGVAENRN